MKYRKPNQQKHQFNESDLRDLVISNFDKYDMSGDDHLSINELTCFFNDILKRKEEKY